MKVIAGLGNPGPEYAGTRHNVGWWVVEAVRRAWGFPAFRARGAARFSQGERAGDVVVLVEPLTYMNHSGLAVAPLARLEGFAVAADLLVVVDDVNLDVGRTRLRPRGSAGGHNGLKSVEAALGSRDYARLRIGVGAAPADETLSDWVLAPPAPGEEEAILALLPGVVTCIESWIDSGAEAAMQRCNR